MKIAIIGAGFTGLSAAYELVKQGHEVTVFEKDSLPGGLAVGYTEKGWDWTLEKHYHHWFTNDTFVLNLAKEIGYPVIIRRPKTATYRHGETTQLDSPLALLTYPHLPFIDKLRMATVLAFLRFNPWWQPLEKINANKFLRTTMGKRAYETLWEPQLRNKMGKYADLVSLVWFWSRIKKRTPSLAYPSGGFLSFAQALTKKLQEMGATILFEKEIVSLRDETQVTITSKDGQKETTHFFDQVLVTLPSFLFLKMAPQLPESYTKKLVRLQGLSATNLVLRLKKPFFSDNTYWLSICEKDAPIMALIEHTNFMDARHYNNEHLLYIGNYSFTHDKLDWSKEKMLALYQPFLEKIHPGFEKELIDYAFFKAPFAQPIVPANYSKMIPPLTTPLPHVYLANIEQVYPWDRGTNYAVELGQKVVTLMTHAK